MTLTCADDRRGPRREALNRRATGKARLRARRVIALPLLLALVLAACSKKEVEAPPAAATQAPVEGAPQIVTSADGVHIEYHVYGTADLAVVLIHGWSCDGNYWKEQIAPLKAKYTTVTV